MDDPDFFIKTITKTLTQEEVMDEMQPILLRLGKPWTESLSAWIEAILIPRKLRLMSPSAKSLFKEWAVYQDDPKYLQWVEDASDNMLSITWTETHRIPRVNIWSDQHPANIALDRLDIAAGRFDPQQRDLVEAKVREIKRYIQCEQWREPLEVEQCTATVRKAIERMEAMEATIIGRLDAQHDETQ